jgi:ubiquinone biosynthesis protein Coq4
MRFNPADWNTYTLKQQKEFHYKSYQEQREIINRSYLSLITDETGNLDAIKILEIIMDLQDRVDEIESTYQRSESYYD